MIVEYNLKGSVTQHSGMFETTGFWLRMEPQQETNFVDVPEIEGWKLFNHGGFAFFHQDKDIVITVFANIVEASRWSHSWENTHIGCIYSYT